MIYPDEFHSLIKLAFEYCGTPINQVCMAEFGNQYLTTGETGKRYFTYFSKIQEHVSFDLNGQDGALHLDLGQKISGYDGHFDIVTNFGTSEHIYNQYWAFRNIYEFLKIGGIALHTIPLIDEWPGHGNYSYGINFFQNLSDAYGYKIIREEVVGIMHGIKRGLLCAVLKKCSYNNHISEEDFYKLEGLHKEENG